MSQRRFSMGCVWAVGLLACSLGGVSPSDRHRACDRCADESAASIHSWVSNGGAIETASEGDIETYDAGVLIVDGKPGGKSWVTVTIEVLPQSLAHEPGTAFFGSGTFFIDGFVNDGVVSVKGYSADDADFDVWWSDASGDHDRWETGSSYRFTLSRELPAGSTVPWMITATTASACGCSISQGHLSIDFEVDGAHVERW